MRMLVTAGPTWEPIDAVRYVGNRSSGKLGLALMAAARERGHDVTALLGPGVVAPPAEASVAVARFESAADLEALLRERFPDHDTLVMAAAVADYRPRHRQAGKVPRRAAARLTIELEPTPDLVAAVAGRRRPGQRIVAFALEESATLEDRARAKLAAKSVDAIVANPLGTMGSDRISAVWLRPGMPVERAGPMAKADFARWLVGRVEAL